MEKKYKIEFGKSRTGTEMIRITNQMAGIGACDYFIKMTPKREIVNVYNDYHEFSPINYGYNLAGTEAGVLVDNICKHLQSYNCLFNVGPSDELYAIRDAKMLATYLGRFEYDFTLTEAKAEIKESTYLKYVLSDLFEEKRKAESLKKCLDLMQNYGTLDTKKIEKIKKEREKAALKAEKLRLKLRKEKIAENVRSLKLKMKEGYTHIAVVRAYSNKGRKFHGETLEFRKEKPTTRNYFTLEKENIQRNAEGLLAYNI